MTQNFKSIGEQEGHIQRDIVIASMMDETLNIEESKLDPLGLSGDSSLAVSEGGLILY